MTHSKQEDQHASRHLLKSHLSPLWRLPLELRLQIYTSALTPHIHTSTTGRLPTYGPGSQCSLSLLLTARQIHHEARPLFHSLPHTIAVMPSSEPWPAAPPSHALAQLRNLTLHIHFDTVNRGDAEVAIRNLAARLSRTDPIAVALRHSAVLRRLRIELLNGAQRKRGGRRLPRNEAVCTGVQRILLPFAYLEEHVLVEVGGFDTIDHVEGFKAARKELSGRELPLERMLDEALGMEGRHLMTFYKP